MKLSIFALSSIFGISKARLIVFAAADGELTFEDPTAEFDILSKSNFFKLMLEGHADSDGPAKTSALANPIHIPVKNLETKYLGEVLQFISKLDTTEQSAITTPFKSPDIKDWGFKEEDANFAKSFDLAALKKMIEAANFLETPGLLKLLASQFAALTMNKTQIEKVQFLGYQMTGTVEVDSTLSCKNGVMSYRTALELKNVKKAAEDFEKALKDGESEETLQNIITKAQTAAENAKKEIETLNEFYNEQVSANEKAEAAGNTREIIVDMDNLKLAKQEAESFLAEAIKIADGLKITDATEAILS